MVIVKNISKNTIEKFRTIQSRCLREPGIHGPRDYCQDYRRLIPRDGLPWDLVEGKISTILPAFIHI